MDFESENSYEDFFEKMRSNEGTRNLRQIFEDDDKPLQGESSNLRYQPHKQEKHRAKTSTARSKPETKPSSDSWTTVVAKVANGYNGSENVGRVGVALSRNGSGAARLVIYKTRNHVLSTLLLTKSIATSIPKDGTSNVILRESYLQFYDDEQHFWSLRFELAADEEEFTEALLNLGLPIEQMSNEEEDVKDSNNSCTGVAPPTSTPLPQSPAKPKSQPQPRQNQRHKKTLASSCDIELPSSYDSESESAHSTDDNIITEHGRLATKALVPLATTSDVMSTEVATSSCNQLEVYLNEQRATGHAMEQKMDTILQAMCRLTNANKIQLSDPSDSTPGSSSADQQQDAKKMDSILQAIGRLNNSSVLQLSDTMNSTIQTSTDNEDELLELEQKLLDFKKQNRILLKSLKAREQALAELRASTCALCEQLLSQNNELKKQNEALVAAMSAQVNNSNSGDNNAIIMMSSSSCSNCDKYVSKISALERRVAVLQSALINCPSVCVVGSNSESTSGASVKASSPPSS